MKFEMKMQRVSFALLVIALLIPRFLFLDRSPPGFFADEAAASAHVVCLAQTTMNCWGDSWPLFSRTWGEGRVGPTFQYLGWPWVLVFGGSIYSLRSLSALVGVLTVIPLLGIVATISRNNKSLQKSVLIACLLSPWAFHSSRIAWDPPLAPFFAVASLYFLLGVQNGWQAKCRYVLAALAASIAALTYPPVGAQLLFLIPSLILFLFFRGMIEWKNIGIFMGVCSICMFGVYMNDTSAVLERVNTVSILSNHPDNPTANLPIKAKAPQFIENILKHFDPVYLFVRGEFNLRHTVGKFGLVSWPESLALFLFALMGVFIRFKHRVPLISSSHWQVLIIGAVGYICATMASSLTWDSLPHALRSIGGWPFLCLVSGVAIDVVIKNRWLKYVLMTTGVIYYGMFVSFYFTSFQEESAWWFDRDVTEALNANRGDFDNWQKFVENRQYPSLARKYFSIEYFGDR